MTKYELSISANYVPTWGIVEAVRELFQNALDEETKDPENKMFYMYDSAAGTFKVGNKNSTLDIQSLLIGGTDKNDDKYIGRHGEGYKLATIVLLRLGHTVTFYNYNAREIWRPRLVKSRKYDGALVPTFFVEKAPFWEDVPEHSLIIEISNFSAEDYESVVATNLHLQDMTETKDTPMGRILLDPKYKGHVYVLGLFVCKNDQISLGYDFTPGMLKLDRDRHLVDTFNLCWTASKLIAATNDISFIKECLSYKDGQYLNYANYTSVVADSIAVDFKEKHANAVPVCTNDDFNKAVAAGLKAIMLSEAECEMIKKSKEYSDPAPVNKTLLERIEDWYSIAENLYGDALEEQVAEFQQLLEELRGVL